MGLEEKDVNTIKAKIAEVDKAIYHLTNSVKIIGELDQDRDLIVSEQENLPEASKRQGLINDLLTEKKKLERLQEKA